MYGYLRALSSPPNQPPMDFQSATAPSDPARSDPVPASALVDGPWLGALVRLDVRHNRLRSLAGVDALTALEVRAPYNPLNPALPPTKEARALQPA